MAPSTPLIDEALYEQTPIQNTSLSLLENLPSELLHLILSHLSARDLVCVSATCRVLAEHGSSELLWAELVNSSLPFPIHDPGQFDSFRRLYLAHQPYWFIPQYKIWLSNDEDVGNVILARYDKRLSVIEAYRVIAERQAPQFHIWGFNPNVIFQSFNPKLSLCLNDPVLLLNGQQTSSRPTLHQSLPREHCITVALNSQHDLKEGSLPLHTTEQSQVNTDQLWPHIPDHAIISREMDKDSVHPTSRLSQVIRSTFRVRRWARDSSETLLTYATIDPTVYAPTKEKPYQGIWVGDYSGHGCEFLLFIQQDIPGASPLSQISHGERALRKGISKYEGQETTLEAIKLTGDRNVPRGEVSFVANDIGPNGLVRMAEEEPFQGSRIVRCLGHVAGLGFHDGR